MSSSKDLMKFFWFIHLEDDLRALLRKAGDVCGKDGWRITRTANNGYFVHTDNYPALGSQATEETKDLWRASDNYSWLVRGKESPYPEHQLRLYTMVPKPAPKPVVVPKPAPKPVVVEKPKPAPVKENPELERLRRENEELKERLAIAQEDRSGSVYR